MRFISWITRKLRPDIKTRSEIEQLQPTVDTLRVLFSGFFSFIGLIWLASVADVSVIADHAAIFVLFFVLMAVMVSFQIFFYFKLTEEIFADVFTNLLPVVKWSAIWLFGYAALVMAVIFTLVRTAFTIWRERDMSIDTRWATARNLFESLALTTFFSLAVLEIYQQLGGMLPLREYTAETSLIAASVPFMMVLANYLVMTPILVLFQIMPIPEVIADSFSRNALTGQLFVAFSIEAILQFFAILAAAIYVGLGWGYYVFNMIGFVLIAFGANRFSHAVEVNRQRTNEMSQLEALGRAFLSAPPDGSQLKDILESHVSNMFFRALVEIRRFPNDILLHNMSHLMDWSTDEAAWDWLQDTHQERIVLKGQRLPWSDELAEYPIVLSPIYDRDTQSAIGGIWLGLGGNPSNKQIQEMVKSVRSLSDQISASLHAVQAYQARLIHEKTRQELAFAGQIQSSFLPDEVPALDNWEISAAITPALQTSGDFYDFILLPDGKLGIVVADVADKGTGAALFMALSRTLLRTYALEHPNSPGKVFAAVNNRILDDTRSGQFVTVFYGVLDPVNDCLTYASAGHNPAYLAKKDVVELRRTGIPLGMMEDRQWQEKTIDMPYGAALVLYTDGVTEAQNLAAELYESERLLQVLQQHTHLTAYALSEQVITDLRAFTGEAQQSDDITLIILRNTKSPGVTGS